MVNARGVARCDRMCVGAGRQSHHVVARYVVPIEYPADSRISEQGRASTVPEIPLVVKCELDEVDSGQVPVRETFTGNITVLGLSAGSADQVPHLGQWH